MPPGRLEVSTVKYVMLPHLIKIEEKTVKTYGIVVFEKPFYAKFVKDVSTDRESVKYLVKDLNDYKVEIVHLDEVIEDFLCQR